MTTREIHYGARTGDSCPVCGGPVQKRARAIPNGQGPDVLHPIEDGCAACDRRAVSGER